MRGSIDSRLSIAKTDRSHYIWRISSTVATLPGLLLCKMWNRRRAPFRRKNNTVLYVNLHRECATRTYYCHYSSPSLRQAPLESLLENAWKRISKSQNSTNSKLSLSFVNSPFSIRGFIRRNFDERGIDKSKRSSRGGRREHSSIISESRLMKIERKGGENPWRDIARRFIIGELVQKSGKFAWRNERTER